MLTIFLNPGFEDGLTGWTADSLTTVVYDTAFGPLPAAKLPGSASISQYCGDAELWEHRLCFQLAPMQSERLGLQLRFEYTDGHRTEAFVGFDVPPFVVTPSDPETNYYVSGPILGIGVAVDETRLLRSFTLTNMNLQASGAVAVTGFRLQGERADLEGDGGIPSGGARKSRSRTRETRGTRMFALERKLDKIIERLEGGVKLPKS